MWRNRAVLASSVDKPSGIWFQPTSSGISVGFYSSGEGRLEFEFAAEEKDADFVVVEVSEAAGRGFQILNLLLSPSVTALVMWWVK